MLFSSYGKEYKEYPLNNRDIFEAFVGSLFEISQKAFHLA